MRGWDSIFVVGALIYGGGAVVAWWIAAAIVLFVASRFLGLRFQIACAYTFGAMGLMVGLFWTWTAAVEIRGRGIGSESLLGVFIGVFFMLLGTASWRHGRLLRAKR